MTKKFLMMFIGLFLLFLLPLSSCSNKEEVVYNLKMEISGAGGLEYGGGFNKELTPQDNVLETNAHYFPDISFKVIFIIEKRVNKIVTFKKEIYPHEENLEGLNHADPIYLKKYTIEDKEGNIIPNKFIRNIHSISYYPDLRTLNCFQLQRLSGKHTITFVFPEIEDWNISETEFKLIINVAEDIRADGAEIRIAESSGSSKSEYTFISKDQTGDYDMYIMGTRWDGSHIFAKELYMPPFAAYVKDDENQDVLLAGLYGVHIPSGGYSDDGEVKLFSRKLDEKYEYNNWSDTPYEPGVYLCSVLYWRSDNYKPVEYKCYIVIPE